MGIILRIWASEPVIITAIVDAVIILAVHAGLRIPADIGPAIDGLIVAVGVLIARSQVSSPATVAASTNVPPKA